ncbi:RDD domain containing protein [Paenibacillus curdlanolyticus YK9]|uniref:RDD domain containing protein n=1 Tax=Paenibacillus curdlanolyticus YK9 TaxID=717606 RepID=E0IAQ2_9BACL|nr:RDD family protein [Paenibacillus curdlanolyticus]EFM10456.1 RDD domain containing protein [Paenibacillus curdlanolyticus YK9]
MEPIQPGKSTYESVAFSPVSELENDRYPSSGPLDAEAIVRTYDSGSVFFRRWGAVVIDNLLVMMIFFGLFAWSIAASVNDDSVWNTIAPFLLVGCYFILSPIYYWLLETFFGTTVGKWALRVRVVNASGELPGIGKAAIRNLMRILEFCPLMFYGIIAGIIVLIQQKKQRLGDMAAKTFVLKARDLPPLERSRLVGMRITHILVIVVALGCLIGGISSVSSQITVDHAVETADGRYEMTVPWSWSADASTESELAVSSGLSTYNVVVGSDNEETLEEKVSLEDYHEIIRNWLPGAIHAELADGETEQTSLNGRTAYRFEMNGEEDGETQAYTITVTGDEDKFYYIIAWLSDDGKAGESYHSFRERYSGKLNKLERIVATFKPINGGVSI